MRILVISFVLQLVYLANGFLFAPGLNNLQSNIQQPCPTNIQPSTHCYPGADCWPSQADVSKFTNTLDGSLLLPNNEEYDKIVPMKNLRVTKFPAMIMAARSTADVQRSLKWAQEHNMHVVVQSSGHDFQGRSTADGAFMIYLGNMTEMAIKLNSDRPDCPLGEISLESGNQWKSVYLELDKVDRVIIGGSAHTVAIGGYTLGGGHSPISRMYGLAVDNLVEVEMVTADSSVVVANDNGTTTIDSNGVKAYSSNTDLFWALRGGGGGTYGIATRFTFRLHEPPKSMVTFSCAYPMYLAREKMSVVDLALEQFFSILPDMPRQWGGYFFMSIYPFENTNRIGSVSFYFNHFGEWNTTSREYMDKLFNFRPELQNYCNYDNKTSFWDYEQNSKDALYTRNYIIGTLAQKESLQKPLLDFLKNTISYPKPGSLNSLTGILLGGKMMEVGVNETSVHPGFRSALLSITIGAGWSGDGSSDDVFSNFIINKNAQLRQFGNGSYPNESTGKSTTWKTDFWGENYDRLEKIKKTWDPNNVFMCNQCVGWDHWKN